MQIQMLFFDRLFVSFIFQLKKDMFYIFTFIPAMFGQVC